MSITQITTPDIQNLAVTEPKLEYQPYYPARVATTGNVILNGISTIDGILLQDGDVILVRLQSLPSDNGIYRVSSDNWTKKGPTVPGTLVGVRQGSQNGLSIWTVRNDMVTWDKFSLSSGGDYYTDSLMFVCDVACSADALVVKKRTLSFDNGMLKNSPNPATCS